MTKTFEPGLEYRRRFSGQEYFLGVFSEGATGRRCVFVGTGRRRHDELAKEASAVANVVVLVVLGQVEHVLTQQPSLLRVRYRQLGGEVQNLQLHYVLLQKQTTHTQLFNGPLPVPCTRTTYGDRSFAVSGPVAWNSLPVALRSSDVTEETFRRQLKTFLYNCLDN